MSRTVYHVVFKSEEHGSDRLGVNFNSPKDAEIFIKTLQQNPERLGYDDWLKNAALWVVDGNGNLL